MPLILEGIVTTVSSNGVLNVAPMGPIVDESISRLTLRPFSTSTTYRNLREHREGVFHITDDVKLLALAAIGKLETSPQTHAAEFVAGHVLADCCRWFEFRVTDLDESQERKTLEAEVVHAGRTRDFFGFNRAKHAVIEAAILATRVGILPAEDIRQQLQPLEIIVQKTAGRQEQGAFKLVVDYIHNQLQTPASIDGDH